MPDEPKTTPLPAPGAPRTTVGEDFSEGMKAIKAAQAVPNDEVEIAADDAGGSALAQKVDEASHHPRNVD